MVVLIGSRATEKCRYLVSMQHNSSVHLGLPAGLCLTHRESDYSLRQVLCHMPGHILCVTKSLSKVITKGELQI